MANKEAGDEPRGDDEEESIDQEEAVRRAVDFNRYVKYGKMDLVPEAGTIEGSEKIFGGGGGGNGGGGGGIKVPEEGWQDGGEDGEGEGELLGVE